MQNKVLIVDFGSQYTQLIARRIRELFIYCEISPFNNLPEDLDEFKAVVLSGSPFSVNQKDSPNINLEQILGKTPILAICYGAQLIAKSLNGNVENSNSREYGRAKLSFIDSNCKLFKNINHSKTFKKTGCIPATPTHFLNFFIKLVNQSRDWQGCTVIISSI